METRVLVSLWRSSTDSSMVVPMETTLDLGGSRDELDEEVAQWGASYYPGWSILFVAVQVQIAANNDSN